eukprot:PhM_4_TR4508/c1_g1_i1/m.7749
MSTLAEEDRSQIEKCIEGIYSRLGVKATPAVLETDTDAVLRCCTVMGQTTQIHECLEEVVRSIPEAVSVDVRRHVTLPPPKVNVRRRLVRCLVRCNPSKIPVVGDILASFSEVDIFSALAEKYQHVHDTYLRTQLHVALMHREVLKWLLVHCTDSSFVAEKVSSSVFDDNSRDDFIGSLRDGVVLSWLVHQLYPDFIVDPSTEQNTNNNIDNVCASNAFFARDAANRIITFLSEDKRVPQTVLFDVNDLVQAEDDERVFHTLMHLLSPQLKVNRPPSTDTLQEIETHVQRLVDTLPRDSLSATCLRVTLEPNHSPNFTVSTVTSNTVLPLHVPIRILSGRLVVYYKGIWDHLGYFLAARLREWLNVGNWTFAVKVVQATSRRVSPLPERPVQQANNTIDDVNNEDSNHARVWNHMHIETDSWANTSVIQSGTFLRSPTLPNGEQVGVPSTAPSTTCSCCDVDVTPSFSIRVNMADTLILGRGAYATVHPALDLSTSTPLAVKIVRTLASNNVNNANNQNAAALRREVAVLQCLTHKHIIRYYGTYELPESNSVAIVLSQASGGSLANVVRTFGALPIKVIRRYAHQLLLGLDFLHSFDVVHRDIKPGNVLLLGDGSVALSDFGCCKFIAQAASLSNNTGVVGTPAYMAPEVVAMELYTTACDVWALGCCLLEVATGERPWQTLGLSALPLLCHIGRGASCPPIPPSVTDTHFLDFLTQCFTIDVKARPSVKALLKHVFVSIQE